MNGSEQAAMAGRWRLRPVREDDLPQLFAYQADPRSMRMAAFTAPNATAPEAYAAKWRRLLADPTIVARAVVETGDRGELLLGSVASFLRGEEREVTYGIAPDHWGRGIATWALKGLLAETEQRPLFARAAKDNLPSLRVLEKCGFVVIGTDEAFAAARGEVVGEYVLKLG